MVKTLNLRESLANSTISDLRGIAILLNVANAATASKGELMEILIVPLGSESALKAAVQTLSPDEYVALAAIIAEGGVVEFGPFQAYFGEIRRAAPPIPPPALAPAIAPSDPTPTRPRFGEPWTGNAANAGRPPLPDLALQQRDAAAAQAAMSDSSAGPAKPEFWHRPASPLESLWYRGLVFLQDLGYSRTLFVPSDVLPVLTPLLAAGLPTVSLEPLAGQFQPAPAPDLLGDLLQFLLLIKKEPLKAVHGAHLPKRALVALNDRLSVSQVDVAAALDETETPYIRILHRLLVELRLITGVGPTLAPTLGVARWLQQGRFERTRELWALLRQRVRLDETCAIRLSSFDDDERTAVARGQIARLIAACPTEQWISLAALSRKVRHDYPQLLRGWHRGDAHVLREPNGRLVTAGASWDRVEGAFITEVVSRTLNWFGLVQMDDSGQAFRLLSMGAAVLGATPASPEEPRPRPIIVQPNFEILVHAEASQADVYRLEDFADLVKRDLASTYTVTRNSLRHTLEAGDNVDAILEFLREASARDVPQNVAYTLREWASQYGQIRVQRLTTISTKTEGQLQELLADPKLKLAAADQLGPTVLAVDAAQVRPLLASLRRAGYMPVAEPGLDEVTARPATLIPVRDVDLVPLLAAARLVCQLAGAEAISSSLLTRLAEQLGPANAEEIARVMGRLEDALSDASRATDKDKAPAARFNTALSLPILETAIRKRLTVQLEYYEESKGSIVRQQVDPWRLERRRGQEYLVGFSHTTLSERPYVLAQIRSVKPTRDRFDPISR